MKNKNLMILVVVWGLLFIPYIIFGGLVRDDLSHVTDPPEFTSYKDFQWYLSSNRDMTARPVSAIVQGLSYWNFGTISWQYHLLNLGLFGGSIIFFYLSIKELISQDIAFLSALFAFLYPCASGTLFSSTMMNSNLAALFWSSATYIMTTRIKSKHILIAILLVLSSLSYEVFIPLFGLNILIILLIFKPKEQGLCLLIRDTTPIFSAYAFYGLYRGYIERAIFDTQFSRIILLSPIQSVLKLLISVILGFKIAFVDSIQISMRALMNLKLLSNFHLTIIVIGFVWMAVNIVMEIFSNTGQVSNVSGYIKKFNRQSSAFRIDGLYYLDYCVVVILLFCFAHLIFAFSGYMPNPSGFENRTLGGVRFITALFVAVIIKALDSILYGKLSKKIIHLVLVGIFFFLGFSMIGQREAWIGAARFNEQTLNKINLALRNKKLNDLDSLTLIAILPDAFPNQINQEPIFGTPWDITPSLSISNPGMVVKANVYNPTAVANSDKVVMVTLTHRWEASYPFWLYKYDNNQLYYITSEQAWFDNIRE